MVKYNKYIILIFFILSCNHNNEIEVKYYYDLQNPQLNVNASIKYLNRIPKHQKSDSLLSQVKIYYKNQEHLISQYIDEDFISGVSCDAGSIFYELDNLGIIYSKSIIWESYKILKSTNDSINNLINFVLENIIARSELSPSPKILEYIPQKSKQTKIKQKQRLKILYNNNNFVVFEYNQQNSFNHSKTSKNKSTSLSELEIQDLELILGDCIQNKGLDSLIRYKRQYIPYINDKGEKEVRVNAFCNNDQDWLSDIVLVFDGGKCYFNVVINLNKKSFYNLSINGVA